MKEESHGKRNKEDIEEIDKETKGRKRKSLRIQNGQKEIK